jgi:hypothetical protein
MDKNEEGKRKHYQAAAEEGGEEKNSAFVLPHRSHALVSATIRHRQPTLTRPSSLSSFSSSSSSPSSSWSSSSSSRLSSRPLPEDLSWFDEVEARGGVKWFEGVTGVLAIDRLVDLL